MLLVCTKQSSFNKSAKSPNYLGDGVYTTLDDDLILNPMSQERKRQRLREREKEGDRERKRMIGCGSDVQGRYATYNYI